MSVSCVYMRLSPTSLVHAASWLALHGNPAAPYDVPHLVGLQNDLAVGYPVSRVCARVFFIRRSVRLLTLLPIAQAALRVVVAGMDDRDLRRRSGSDVEDRSRARFALAGDRLSGRDGQSDDRRERIFYSRAAGRRSADASATPDPGGVMFGRTSHNPQYGILGADFSVATGRRRTIVSASVTVMILAVLSFAIFGGETWHGFFSSVAFTAMSCSSRAAADSTNCKAPSRPRACGDSASR